MTAQKDLVSSLTKGFPKGIKVNKTLPASAEMIENIHNRLIEFAEEHGYTYQDIINELKIIGDGVYTNIKVALNRDAILLSAESENVKNSKKMVEELSKIISELELLYEK